MSDEEEREQESIPRAEDHEEEEEDDEQSMNVDDAEEDEGPLEEDASDNEDDEVLDELITIAKEQQPDQADDDDDDGDGDGDDGSKEGKDADDDDAKEMDEDKEEGDTSRVDEKMVEKYQTPNQDEEGHDNVSGDINNNMDLDDNKEDENENGEKEEEKEVQEEEEEEEESGSVILGGDVDTPAFFLLTGHLHTPTTNNNTNEEESSNVPPPTKVHLPITRLPAILGRSHETKDPYFFGIGNRKALSRKQCIVYYRDTVGGRVDQKGSRAEEDKKDDDDDKNDAFYYNKKGIPSSKPPKKETIIRKNQDENPLPTQGFFAIECVGKNRIIVDGMRVEQGEVAMLQHGSTLRVNQYNLYFLLPKSTSEDNDDDDREILTVPNPNYKKIVSKSKSNKRKPKASETAQPPTKKRKSIGKSASSIRHHGLGGTGGIAAELESLPVLTLLKRMTTAIESNMWDRKHQMIGSAVSLHAVKDAARSKKIQRLAAEGDGVARTDIMAWIKETKKYKKWVAQMMTKMEAKSYQSSISKALGKAGYTRTGTTGRHVKWILPAGMENDDDDDDDDDDSSSNSSDDDGDDDDDNDNDSDDEPNEKEQSEPDDDSGDEKENNSNNEGDSSEDENEGPSSEDKEDENEGSEEDA